MSTNYTIRQATVDDAYTLARMRDEMAIEMAPDEAHDDTFRERTFVYWYEMLGTDRAISWIAEQAGEPVAMASLLLHHHPPRRFGERRRGYVTAVYVVPQARRQGIALALMHIIIAWGREQGLQRLELRSSDMGRPLYPTLGFKPQEVLMLNIEE